MISKMMTVLVIKLSMGNSFLNEEAADRVNQPGQAVSNDQARNQGPDCPLGRAGFLLDRPQGGKTRGVQEDKYQEGVSGNRVDELAQGANQDRLAAGVKHHHHTGSDRFFS